jgi:type VI secretion system secreted protein Hcp
MADQQLFFIDLNTGAGIAGESTKVPHVNWMECASWSFSMHQTADSSLGTTAGTGTAAIGSFSFERAIDRASPRLMDRCSRGSHIPTVAFEGERQGTAAAGDVAAGSTPSTVYIRLVFTDVVISGRTTNWSDGSRGTETISFAFGQVQMTHTQILTTGQIGARTSKQYNAKANLAS